MPIFKAIRQRNRQHFTLHLELLLEHLYPKVQPYGEILRS